MEICFDLDITTTQPPTPLQLKKLIHINFIAFLHENHLHSHHHHVYSSADFET